jgi:hypothetical protein
MSMRPQIVDVVFMKMCLPEVLGRRTVEETMVKIVAMPSAVRAALDHVEPYHEEPIVAPDGLTQVAEDECTLLTPEPRLPK